MGKVGLSKKGLKLAALPATQARDGLEQSVSCPCNTTQGHSRERRTKLCNKYVLQTR